MLSSSIAQASALVLAALPAVQAQALLSWEMADVPESGLSDISFPMSMAGAPHDEGFYFAMQYNFVGQEHVGYTGLQPRPDENGSSIIHAVFSSFIDGTTSDDENCNEGADGGPGYSCAAEIPAPYEAQYELKISNTEGTTWTGTLVHSDTGKESHIGTYTLPEGSGGITDGQMGFVERYLGTDTCADMPFTSIVFGSPTTDTEGAGEGSLGDAYESGDCEGQIDFQKEVTEDTTKITCGFK